MLQRVMPDLMGLKSVLVINDEAHHCYRHKTTPEGTEADEDLEAEEKEEAEKNSEAARLWISGIETVKRKLDVRTVFDLSATPFSCAAPAMQKALCSRGRSATSRSWMPSNAAS